MEGIRIGVKYCGGCREQYDRKSAAARIRENVLGAAEFVPAEAGGTYDALLVICGCPTCCADISGYRTDGNVVKVAGEGDCVRAQEELTKTVESKAR